MNKQITLKIKLELCDRNRNFDEIIESIYQVIKERDGVDGFIALTDNEKTKNKDFSKKLREWHNLVIKGLCNGLTHTYRDKRNDDIEWVRKRLELFESFSRCVMDYEWGQNYKDYSEKNLKEISDEGYSLDKTSDTEKKKK